MENSTGKTIFLLCAVLAVGGCREPRPAPLAGPSPVVEVAHPLVREVTDYQVFTARAQAVQAVDLKARVTGYLTKVCFKDGDEIKAGDVLFEIDDRPYKAALTQAKGQHELQKAAVVKTQADLEIALAAIKGDPAAVSQQEIDRRKGARDEAQGALVAAEGALANAQLNYDWCKVASPIPGKVNRHFVDVGNLITADQTLLTNIVSLRPIWAYFDVDENTFLKLDRLIQARKFPDPTALPVTMALADNADFPWKGTVDFLSNQVDPGTGTIRFRAVFANQDGTMLAGMFGRVRLPVSEPHHALLVNARAVGSLQGDNYVYVVNDQNDVEYRPVQAGEMHGGLREVSGTREFAEPGGDTREAPALSVTDRVIVRGLQRVRPGTKVAPRIVDMVTLVPVK